MKKYHIPNVIFLMLDADDVIATYSIDNFINIGGNSNINSTEDQWLIGSANI